MATIYIYPAPPLRTGGFPKDAATQAELCAGEFGGRKQEVAYVHPDAKLVQERGAVTPSGEARYYGRKAVFEYRTDFWNVPKVPVRSILYVYCYVDGKWAFEYRFTYPRTLDGAPDLIDDLMRSLTWTVPAR